MARRNLLVLVAYLALALILTWPLVAQFGDHVPGTATWSLDEYTLLWNNWWFKHAVFDLGVNPLQTNFLYYPLGTSLVFYMYTLLHVVIGLPVQFAFGLVPASNTEILFAFVMTGYGAFLLVRYFFRVSDFQLRDGQMQARNSQLEILSAFVAGALFAFSSNRFVYASLGHYNMVGMEWVPFYILFLLKTVHENRWHNPLLAGLFLALALYVEMTYGVLLLIFTAIYLLFAWRTLLNRAAIGRLAALVAAVAILFAPLLIPTLGEIFNSGYTMPGWGSSDKLLVDLLGFLTPTGLNPLARNWTAELDLVRQGVSRFSDANTVYVGYVTLALALIGGIRWRKMLKVWVTTAIVSAILCLGPLLHIGGQSVFDLDGLTVTFPLPFLLFHYIPILKENRTPNRFSVLLMLALAVLVAYAIMWTSAKLRVKNQKLAVFLPFALLFLILFEHASIPLPLTDARVPEVYAQIAREPGDFAVLTLPLGWRNSFGPLGAEDTRTQYYQSVHGKFIFPGNINRNPPFQFDYFDRISVFHSITELEMYHEVPDEVLASDRASAPALMSFFDVRYVVVNAAVPGRPPYSDTRSATTDYVQKVLPLGEKIYDRDGVVAYRVNQAPLPAKQQIAFGTGAAYLYQAEGWDRDETILDAPAQWANRQDARILLPVRQVADYQLTVRALPFTYLKSPAQTMDVAVNGQPVQKLTLNSGWQDYTITIPARVLHSGINDVTFQFAYLVRPRDVLPTNFAIGNTETSSPVDIVVNASALGSIKVNGREVSLLGRGYNFVVIDPKSGAIVSAKVFNTGDDRSQSRTLTDFIGQIPNGYIVAVASQEDVAANLGNNTVAAFRSLGAQVDIRQNPNRSHAIIGVKGAPAGTALEQSVEGTSFISVGHSPDERTLSVAVSSITFERK